jgi:hypothetical protein
MLYHDHGFGARGHRGSSHNLQSLTGLQDLLLTVTSANLAADAKSSRNIATSDGKTVP